MIDIPIFRIHLTISLSPGFYPVAVSCSRLAELNVVAMELHKFDEQMKKNNRNYFFNSVPLQSDRDAPSFSSSHGNAIFRIIFDFPLTVAPKIPYSNH